MEEWVNIDKIYSSELQAQRASQIIRVTESRLISAQYGRNFDVEVEVVEHPDGWQVRWRKVLMPDTGCSGCGGCQSHEEPVKPQRELAKVFEFKPRNLQKGGE